MKKPPVYNHQFIQLIILQFKLKLLYIAFQYHLETDANTHFMLTLLIDVPDLFYVSGKQNKHQWVVSESAELQKKRFNTV